MAVRLDHARLIALCERLSEATLAGDAKWRGEGEDHYIWERKEGAVAVEARDRDGQPPYQLIVFNGKREKVEELASALVDDDQPAAWNQPLAELYRVARRSALNADEIIDALMAALPAPAATQELEAEAPPDAVTAKRGSG
jgi:hypothetical protein